MGLKFVGAKMALRLVLLLLALRMVHSASLPPLALDSVDASVDAHALDASDGRMLDVGDGEDEPIALLIGKDVKRVMRRKGPSDGNLKVSRRLEQHKDLESHLLESHEWSPRDSDLERILDPVSLEDPKDIELKKAIAQLLKEVADREEKRKNRKKIDSNEGKSKESDNNVLDEDLNVSTDHHKIALPQDYPSHEGTTESNDEVNDHVDSVIDTKEDFDDTKLRSDTINVNDDSKVNEEDHDYDDDGSVSHEVENIPQKQESLKHDDHYDEKDTDVQHNIDNDLEKKANRHSDEHASKETLEDESGVENDNINNIMLEQSIDSVSEDKNKSEESEHGSDHDHRNSHVHHGDKRRNHHHDIHHKNQNMDVEISHDSKILKNELHEDQSHKNHDDDIKNDSQNESARENSLSEEKHNEEISDESDQIEEHYNIHDSMESRIYSFENYGTPNEDSDENGPLKYQEAHKIISQSSNDDNDLKHHRRSYSDSSKSTENDKSENYLGSNLNPTNKPSKDHHQNDSIEILRYHVPQRYRSRGNDRISKSYRRSSRKRTPIKQYTLSFFLRK